MKREFLKELGVADDIIDKIMGEHGKTVNGLKDDLTKVDELKTQLEESNKQLSERDKQLEKLSKDVKGNEEFESKIKELQELNESTKTEYENKLKQSKIDFAIEKTFADAKNIKAAKALLDMDLIKLGEDGKVIGIDEQKQKLQESDSYLFESAQTKPTFTDGEHNREKPSQVDEWKEAFK